MTTYTLALIPEGCRVVPEEPTDEMYAPIMSVVNSGGIVSLSDLGTAIKSAPQPDTPPVLRWEGDSLCFYNLVIARIYERPDKMWGARYPSDFVSVFRIEQEARRAAERSLGFLDGLIVEVVG